VRSEVAGPEGTQQSTQQSCESAELVSPAAPREPCSTPRAQPVQDPVVECPPASPARQLTRSPELPPDWKPPAPSAEFVELAISSRDDPGWESVSIQMVGGTVTALRHSGHPSPSDTLLEVVSARLYSFEFGTDRQKVWHACVRAALIGWQYVADKKGKQWIQEQKDRVSNTVEGWDHQRNCIEWKVRGKTARYASVYYTGEHILKVPPAGVCEVSSHRCGLRPPIRICRGNPSLTRDLCKCDEPKCIRCGR
jgi:hypothetical protein